ncbi:MAG: hypothetical protein IJR68_05580 [Fretibacterium sp.]|nr:hypothetical protein [Fretibacterium sp.]
MPEKLGVAVASLGSCEGRDGKRHAKTKNVGYLIQHSDGRCYIMMDATFDYGRIPVGPGHDAFFLEVRVPDGLKLELVEKPVIR